MSNSRIVVRPRVGWLLLLLAALLLASCGGEEYMPADDQQAYVEQFTDDEADEQQYVDDESDWYYAETPEDCLEDEEFDPVDELCYLVVDCDADGDCGDESSGFGQEVFGFLDEIAWGGSGDGFEDAEALQENTLVTYRVDGNQIADPELAEVSDDLLDYQDDSETQQKLWTYFVQLIPPDQRALLTQYVVFTDGPEETLAFVTADTADPSKWILAVDIADGGNVQDLTFTLVHEFAHLLTLNNQQVPADYELAADPENQDLFDEAVAACPTYFPGEGCSNPNSYINAFFERFWGDNYADWQQIDLLQYEDNEEYTAALDQFYVDNEDEFVSDYAATNPGEDIAESFATFVLKPAPTGDTLADQKVAFFYDYPELVKLRAEISGRLVSRLRRQ